MMTRRIIFYSRGRVTDSSFEANQLVNNDAKRTGGGEIAVSFATGNTVQHNIVKPNEQNVIMVVDQTGGLRNSFDYQVYYPNGNQATEEDLIFYWGTTECDGLKAFQEVSKQERHAIVE
jgi:hypothetical protein